MTDRIEESPKQIVSQDKAILRKQLNRTTPPSLVLRENVRPQVSSVISPPPAPLKVSSRFKTTSITILTTNTCTATCSHCCMNSSPRRRGKLTFDQIKETVDQVNRLGALRVVVFAGGEPTLLKDALFKSIAYCNALGLVTRIVTNASWANTDDNAKKMILKLRKFGLSELNLSSDDYHLPDIPFENIKRAWNHSKNQGFRSVVIANCFGPKSKITPSFIANSLGEDLQLRYDSDGKGSEYHNKSSDGTLYMISNARVQLLGRGEDELTDVDKFPLENENALDLPCPFAVRSLALSPTGQLLACCGFENEGLPHLDFGSTSDRPVAALLRSAGRDAILNAIALLGPYFVKKFIEERTKTSAFRKNPTSICEICSDITTRNVNLNVLYKHASALVEIVETKRRRIHEERQAKDN
jgi:hypothetical protein